jgi:hypothetical protein
VICEENFMKKLIVFAAAATLAVSAFAQSTNLNAPVVQRRTVAPVTPAATEGGLQRGARLGNPAQMLNPLASQKYGDGREFLTPRDEGIAQRPLDRSRPQSVGFRLFSFSF